MAKKRKSSTRVPAETSEPILDAGQSRKRIRDFEDVAGSDDEFHLNRDKVLLDEGPAAKRRRKWQEEEEFLQPSDEEVLGQSDVEDDEEEEFAATAAEEPRPRQPAHSDVKEEGGVPGEDEDQLGWGTSRADLYGADAIETEEQALEEEAEALRLQKRQLQSMTAADYGFDEHEWQTTGDAADALKEQDAGTITEVLPQLQIAESMGPAERLKLLKARYPEFEPLSKELLRLQDVHATLVKAVDLARDSVSRDSPPVVMIKLRAASAYIGALTMYFTLLTSTAATGKPGVVAMSATLLRDHSVMDSLVQCRDLWHRVKDLLEDNFVGHDNVETTLQRDHILVNGTTGDRVLPAQSSRKTPQKSRAQRHADAMNIVTEARTAERLRRTEAGLADLDALIAAPFATTRPAAALDGGNDDSAVGEEAPLTAKEAADKAKRKKTLRFYTSQIAQKANKRNASGRHAGGDDDIPHRERLKDRHARLNTEAEKRGRKQADSAAELGGESDEDDAQQAKQIREDIGDDYYDLIATRTAAKKSDKAAYATAQREAALQNARVVEEETVGADGKRKISYLIEKNKGLTPHRKKEVRNPRVKKRKKYEEKKKKLASIKPIYKGGEGRGGYGGELTGIKKGLVKSTKL